MNIKEAFEIIKNELPLTSGAVEEALNLIEIAVGKQAPKRLVIKEELYCCPNCGENGAVLQGDSFCFNCGQALDWSDTNE